MQSNKTISELLTENDLIVGNRYTPLTKSVFGDDLLFKSVAWGRAQQNKQSFLYYIGKDDDFYVFNDTMCEVKDTAGDFFNPSDVIPYEATENPTPKEQVEGDVLEDANRYFYTHKQTFTGINAGSYLDEGDFEIYAKQLANRVKELEGQLQNSLLLYNNQVSNIEKLQGENEILREALQDIKRLTDNYRVMETLEGLDILCSHVNTKAKAALQQNK